MVIVRTKSDWPVHPVEPGTDDLSSWFKPQNWCTFKLIINQRNQSRTSKITKN